MTQQKKQFVTYEEQQAMGLIKPVRNFVQAEIVPQVRQIPTALSAVNHTISVAPTATQHIEVHTNSVDRAKGFLLAGLPLYAAWGFGSLIVSVLFWDLPVLSLTGLVVFWVPFILAWGWGYLVTLVISAEGTSWYEARRKWDVIDREQKERWRYYRGLNGDK